MKYLAPYIEMFHEQFELFMQWVGAQVLTLDAAVQGTLIVALFLAAQVLSAGTARWLEEKLKNRQTVSLIKIYASYKEIFFLVYMVLFLWMAVLLMQAIELPFQLLTIIASLGTAWAVIRFTSSTIESAFWSQLVAVVLWVVAALNIMGWLAPTIDLMNKAAVNIGEVRLSLLLVVKSLLALAVLLWSIGFVSGMMQRGFSKARGLTPSQKVLFFKLANIALYITGGLIALNIVGIDLTALAVFSGALGLGIGFGLQKVFSNLISGIILLLDKSVKPGDVIAIGETFGWVNRLGARCVSVLTRDGKEHLIPNENLIAEKVENWSYSDDKVRVRIPIGVSYHSDMTLVRDLLFKAVDDMPRILKEPRPNCLITGFGDSSVDHELRVWIRDPSEGVGNVKSAVYYRIWELFKENNIQIPFPQRDVHLDVTSNETLGKLLAKRS